MKKNSFYNWLPFLTAGMAVGMMPVGAAQAVDTQIQTDNTLSGITALNVNAPGSATTYQITEANGKTAGSNLFYSFSNFNVGASDTAHFNLNSSNLSNVVSRVTGGFESVIDGGIKMTNAGSSPAFFFINPAGITFGAGASVDVPGSFYASTASSLQFVDGYQYNADGSNTSTLSAAAPESFGFLGDETGAINIEGASLTFKPGTSAAFIGSNLDIEGATLANSAEITGGMVEAGVDLQFVATGTIPSEVPLGTLPDQAFGGAATFNAAYIDVSGNGSGSLTLRADDANITNSSLYADNYGALPMQGLGGIDIHVRSLDIDGSWLSNDVYGTGAALGAKVVADQTLILANSSHITSDVYSEGNGGEVYVATGSLSIYNGCAISSNTFSLGNAGSVTVDAGQLTIEGQGDASVFTGIASMADPGGNVSNETPAISGNAGQVTVSASDLNILNGGEIHSSTFGSGNAGSVTVNAGQLNIDSQGSPVATGIFSGSDLGSSGNAGQVTVSASDLNILNGGEIHSSTFGSGDAGSVTVNAGQLTIDTRGSPIYTGIATTAAHGGSGSAGQIVVTASEANLDNGGQISSSSNGPGNAGSVMVDVGQLTIDGQSSSISSNVTGATGNAGQIAIFADTLTISNGGYVATDTYGSGNGGEITLQADTIDIGTGAYVSSSTYGTGSAGAIDVNVGDLTVQGFGAFAIEQLGHYLDTSFTGIRSIAGLGSGGQAGNIDINAKSDIALTDGAQISISNAATVAVPSVLQSTTITLTAPDITLSGSQIVADSSGNVDAGDITINFEDTLFLDPSAISTVANAGNGGDITINGGNLIYLQNSEIVTSVLGTSGNGGDINITADYLIMDTGFIQANTAAEGATGGLVNIDVDALIPSGSLLYLGGDTPYQFQPYSGINVIQAAAPGGVSGTINVANPQLNLSGTLANLVIPAIDPNALSRNMCAAGDDSSLLQTGNGGLRRRSKDALVSTKF